MALRPVGLRRRGLRREGDGSLRRCETVRDAAVVLVLAFRIDRVGLAGVAGLRRLGAGDQAEIMLGVLEIAFRGDGVARGLRVPRQLEIFFGDLVGVAPDLHVGAVRLVGSGERIGTLAIAATVVAVVRAATHALVLTWSHRSSLG